MGLGWLRRLKGRNDARLAVERGERRLREALAADAVDPAFGSAMRSAGGLVIGTAAHDAEVLVRLDPDDLIGRGHAIVLGGTGAGKTRMVGAVVARMLERAATENGAARPWIIDHKGDLAAMAQDTAASLAARLPPAERERLIESLVVVDPFSDEALVPLQILAREPGTAVDEELQAYEVTTLFARLAGADLGIRQDALAYHLVLLGITRGMTIVDLPPLLSDTGALVAAAAGSPSPQVRAFFPPGFRAQAASVAGLQARFARLLRAPGTRRMLGARGCLDFRAALRDKIVIANFGGSPLGTEDLGRFWSGFFTLKATRAIFDRPAEEARRKVLLVSDEWQEGLMGGRDAAENYERVLAMARSKGVAAMLVSQSLAGAAKVSSSLPRVVSTNTSVQILFRASIEDARAMAHLLPVTGRRKRQAPFPWEGRRDNPFLSRSEELNLLVEEAASLPDRHFYYWERGAPYRAQLVRTADFDPSRPAFLPADIARRIRVGSAAVAVAELEADPAERAAAPTVDQEEDAPPLGPPRRRRRR